MATHTRLQANRPPAGFMQRPLPPTVGWLVNGLLFGVPSGALLGGLIAAIGYGFSLLISMANPAAGVVCGVMAGIGLIGGALSFQGNWWQRILCGLVVAGLAAAPYGLLAAGIAAPWVFGGLAAATALGIFIWMAVCRFKAILNPLTKGQMAALDQIAPDAEFKLSEAENELREQLAAQPDEPTLKAIEARLKECRENELPGCFSADKRRMEGARKKQFLWLLGTSKAIDPQTQQPLPSEREQYQASADRLKEAFGSTQWLVPYDLQLALKMRVLALRQQRLEEAIAAWPYLPPHNAQEKQRSLERLDIMPRAALIAEQAHIACDDYVQPRTVSAQQYEQLCQQLGTEGLDAQALEQYDEIGVALRGRQRLLEKARQAERLLGQLEPLYNLDAFNLNDVSLRPRITLEQSSELDLSSDEQRSELSSSRVRLA